VSSISLFFSAFAALLTEAQATQKAKGDIRKVLGILNDHLQTRTFLVHERVSLADIIVACSLVDLYKTVRGFRFSFFFFVFTCLVRCFCLRGSCASE
jgi:glutathione S-transferase